MMLKNPLLSHGALPSFACTGEGKLDLAASAAAGCKMLTGIQEQKEGERHGWLQTFVSGQVKYL